MQGCQEPSRGAVSECLRWPQPASGTMWIWTSCLPSPIVHGDPQEDNPGHPTTLHEDPAQHSWTATPTLPTSLAGLIASPVEQGSRAIHKLHISVIKVFRFPNPFGLCTFIWSKTTKAASLRDWQHSKKFKDMTLDNSVTSLSLNLRTCKNITSITYLQPD